MNPQNRGQIIAAAIAGVVLVAVLLYQFVLPKGGDSPPVAKAGASSAAGTRTPGIKAPTRLAKVDVDIDALLKEIEVVNFDYDKERIDRNPLTPLVGFFADQENVPPPIDSTLAQGGVMRKSVTGILWDNQRPLAVVDDEVVAPGHHYPDGVIVETIERDRVVFRIRESLIPVQLKEL